MPQATIWDTAFRWRWCTEEAAEVLQRRPDGTWPERPDAVGPEGELRFESMGFAAPSPAAYGTARFKTGAG